MKRQLFLMLVVCGAILLPAAGAPAQTTFIATDDAYIRAGVYADSNWNLSWTLPGDALRIRSLATNVDNWRRTYVRFDITSYTGPVASAKLQMWVDRAVNSNPPTGSVLDRADIFTVADDNWNESTITWNNAPPRVEYLTSQIFNRRVTADPDTMYEWDVTSYVQAEYAGNQLISFFLVDTIDANQTDLRMFSRETFGFEPALVISPTTDVPTNNHAVPEGFLLGQNYPNPFNPATVITFALPSEEIVRLEVVDVLGRVVSTLLDEKRSPGEHAVSFDVGNLGSGVYFYTMSAGKFRDTKRMLVLR